MAMSLGEPRRAKNSSDGCPRGCPQPLLESATAPATASSAQQPRQGPAPAADSARSPPGVGWSSGAGGSGSGAGSAHARWGRSRTSGRRRILWLLRRCAGDREGGAGPRWHLLSFLSSVLDAGIAERPFFARPVVDTAVTKQPRPFPADRKSLHLFQRRGGLALLKGPEKKSRRGGAGEEPSSECAMPGAHPQTRRRDLRLVPVLPHQAFLTTATIPTVLLWYTQQDRWWGESKPSISDLRKCLFVTTSTSPFPVRSLELRARLRNPPTSFLFDKCKATACSFHQGLGAWSP
ncbi:uncharacterized protein LOC121101669 [Ursus maritimus]|uniref:Uncharacterized protein LOC121101669 n=1 Tax=Ursus maritimus TaxID=29073 RepID=A0A8M1FDT0_URSMA|nr:uncharacterized protein LOC121101669 [Ursus maritimus]